MGSRKKIIYAGLFCLFCVVVWIVTYNIRCWSIEQEVNQMMMNQNYVEEVTTTEPKEIVAHINGVDYSIQELSGVNLTAGDIVDVTVTYDNGEVCDTKAYVTYSPDISNYVIRYDSDIEGSKYGRIVLPMKEDK